MGWGFYFILSPSRLQGRFMMIYKRKLEFDVTSM